CSMVINGTARQSCASLVGELEQTIYVEPMSTFLVVRDLIIDRERMCDVLKSIKAWIPIDGTHERVLGARMVEKNRQWAYEVSKCMTCGVCIEACPNINEKSNFIGPALLSLPRLYNNHPTGAMNKSERLDALMQDGGVTGC